jgi:hypothetical protein
MNKQHVTRASVALTLLFLISLGGCQKNSYESCIEIQTETATRQYNNLTPERRGSVTLQEYIDMLVPARCAGVK